MRETSGWSLSLGQWGGVNLRLHALFLLFGFCAIFLVSREPVLVTSGPNATGAAQVTTNATWYAILGIGILFFSVVAHEFGHAIAAWRFGASVDNIVIGPLGGLAPIGNVQDPQGDILIALAGPVVNMLIALILTPVILFSGTDLVALLRNPFYPQGLLDGGELGMIAVRMACWINLALVLVNMLPAVPLDMGRVLRAIFWPTFDYRTAGLAVSRFGKIIALLLFILALVFDDAKPGCILPPWFPLGLLAMYVFFHSRQEFERLEEHEVDEDPFGYDFSQGYTSLDQPHPPSKFSFSGIRLWLEERRAEKARRQREIELEEERRVDGILDRLHSEGMNALTPEERTLLLRVSARYRNRQQAE